MNTDNTKFPMRIALVCFGLDAANLRKQPWHSVWGIAQGLQQNGCEVTVITDATKPPSSDSIRVMHVDAIYQHNQPSQQLQNVLVQLQLDRVIVTAGTQELLRPQRFAFNAPVTLLLANQRFERRELQRLSPGDWRREWRMLKMPLLQSLLPAFLLQRQVRRAGVAHLLFLSDAAQKRHGNAGLAPGSVVRPRIGSEFLPSALSTQRPVHREPVLCFFGSPLLLRGAHDVISAFAQACRAGLQARLALYIRADDAYTRERAIEIKRHIDNCAADCKHRIDYIDARLTPQMLAEKLAAADVFVLPFKITVSDVPLVVIEAAMHGKPVLTFDTPGVSEWRAVFSNITLCQPHQLAAAMQRAVTQTVQPPQDPAQWTNWQAALVPFAHALRQTPDISALLRYRMVCLIGIDGCGKSTLLTQLSEQLSLQQQMHGYVWSRFRNYLSKPLLALTRLTGHNRKVEINGVRIGLHEFASNRFLSRLFLLLQKCDMWLDIALRYRPRLRHELILGDRCPLDTLVDLAIDTGMDNTIFGDYGSRVMRWLPQPALVVMVTRNTDNARSSRPDIVADPFYERRMQLYERLARTFNLPVLQNDGSITQSLLQLCHIAKDNHHGQPATRL